MRNNIYRCLCAFTTIRIVFQFVIALALSLNASAQFGSSIEQILADDSIRYEDKAAHLADLGPDAIPTMIQFLEQVPRSRFHIVPALGELGDIRGVDPILGLMETRGNEWMVESLAKMGGPKSEAGILAIMRSEDMRLIERYVAAEAIAQMGSEASKSEAASFLLDETYLAAKQQSFRDIENYGTRFIGKEWWSALRALGTEEATDTLVKWFKKAPMPYDKEHLIKEFVEFDEPPASIVNTLLEYALNGDVGELYLRVSALEALVGYGDALPRETILSAFDPLQSGIELNRLVDLSERLKGIRSDFDARLVEGFVSRDPATGEESEGAHAPELQQPAMRTNVPSIQAASNQELDEPISATESAPTEESEEPEGSEWSDRMLVVAIGAVILLLAYAGYRAFARRGRSEF